MSKPAARQQQRLGATITGSGERVIVFGNGHGTSQATWRHVTDSLKDRARIVRFDNVDSPLAPPGAYVAEAYGSLFAYVDDLVELLDEMDLRDVLFVGHSISGIIGLLAAIAAPERIGRLALICSSPRYLDDVDFRAGFSRDAIDAWLAGAQNDFVTWARQFAADAIGPDATAAQSEEFSSLLAAIRPDIALRTLQMVFNADFRAPLPRVTQPVWVLHSLVDVAVPITAGEYLAQHLPNATLVPLEAHGHLPHLTAPDEVAQILHHLLDSWT